MEKLLIMCEGPNEKEIIKILLENDLLKFTENDLLGLTPYHANKELRTGKNGIEYLSRSGTDPQNR